MSWEKVSGIRFNYDKNILDLKSHSNNDDAAPEWWSYGKDKDIKTRLINLYLGYKNGEIQISSFTGTLLNFKYGFIIYGEYLKEHKETPSIDNIGIMIVAITTNDTKDYCCIKYDGYYVCNYNKYKFSYTYSDDKKDAKHFTYKQFIVFLKIFSKDYDFEIEYNVPDDEIRGISISTGLPTEETITTRQLDRQTKDAICELINDYLAESYGYCNNGFNYDVVININNIDWDK